MNYLTACMDGDIKIFESAWSNLHPQQIDICIEIATKHKQIAILQYIKSKGVSIFKSLQYQYKVNKLITDDINVLLSLYTMEDILSLVEIIHSRQKYMINIFS
jgi:hypothetical protein